MEQAPLLSVRDLTMRFGSLLANDKVSFDVEKGQIVALIGPNGAGKTTCFSCLSGFYAPTSGKVRFDGHDTTGMKPYHTCRLGMTRTFQVVKTMGDMTVEENVLIGAFLRHPDMSTAKARAKEAMEATGMLHLAGKFGKSLTIADRKRLEITRALATEPKLLMLDETMAGLNPTETREAMDLCLKLKGRGITLIIVEHVMEAIMPISDKAIVLDSGRKIAEGRPSDIVRDEVVIKAYLGENYNAKS
ncbi:MAG TPA: ABC transporter ATP-binding protein [Bacillota bacterium]|nr:MAG: Lipopolysaccharide export system ATP-binding protein LptB [Firmicutes bacterium ADurb.Bin153]HNV34422.1 ABC transporter ATP-binding protein [Bacillota bacterium]